ncbi:uncharacterized protein LOC110694578 [Chenopodium quinoa]|uniref:uncharacterized protein LOC110694578 n=1 Tax=Chenopodium quinoa TaxID=63459 RepID=UPI000B76DCEF|nr:uncharacterized protein LOC110694578 [Chenopodium quinoa]
MGFYHAKDIWDALEKKYGSDDACTKRYCVSKWLSFQVVDDKPIIDQIHAYENVCIIIATEGLSICDITLAVVLIEKLPPSWKDFRNQLMHKKKELTLEELSKAKNTLKPNGKVQKYKFKGTYYECEANFTGNVAEWIVDTRHICANKDMFTTYDKVEGENVFMGNSTSASIQGKGKIVLTLTSGKLLTLTNVLHVLEMCRNLISSSLLMKDGLKLSFDSDRLVLTRNRDFMNNLYDNTILPMKLNLRLNLINFREWEKELRNVLTSHGLESRLYIPVESIYTEKYGAERHAEIVSARENQRAHFKIHSNLLEKKIQAL